MENNLNQFPRLFLLMTMMNLSDGIMLIKRKERQELSKIFII
jgi:hypothetical protein